MLISQEREAYARYVPVFFHHGTYPSLEAFACSRQLAGIAYGYLGASPLGALAPTLSHIFWEEDRTDADITAITSHVFRHLLPQADDEHREAETLRQAYQRRFHFLRNPDNELNRRLKKALVRLNDLVNIHDEDVITFGSPQSVFAEVKHPVEGLRSNVVAFQGYRRSVVHGDLHSDNILFPSKEAGLHPFFIDFAHTGPHHLFLDYLVLEMSARGRSVIHSLFRNFETVRRTPS